MGIYDRLAAKGRGAAQVASAGTVDALYPKILANLPFDDGTGIPREYAAGSAEEDYRQNYKAADAEAARKYPRNFMDGGLLMGAVQGAATGGLGAAGQVAAGTGLGAIQGYGNSERGGIDRIKDAVAGGAAGGALASGANALAAAAPAAKQAWQNLRQGPPPALQPALAGSSVSRTVPRPVEQAGGAQINRMAPPKGDAVADIPIPAPPRHAMPPPRPATGDLEMVGARESIPPVDISKPLPKQAKLPPQHGTTDEVLLDRTEEALRKKEASWQAEHNKNYVGKKIDREEEYRGWEAMKAKQAAEKEMRASGTVRPGRARAGKAPAR